jgi:hypothetical protein
MMAGRVARNPVRSETDAFWLAVATVVLAALAVLVGWLARPLIGLLAFLALALVALVAYLRLSDEEPRLSLREAAHGPHPSGPLPGGWHVLVVANESLHGEELRERLRKHADAAVELDVLAPVLSSRTHFTVTDIDRERQLAQQRLQRSLAWARAQGFVARGEVGDPINPTAAIEDELRDFGADEVIVVTSSGVNHWQEQGQLKRLRDELDVPVVHVAVG